ncbi:acyl-CoA N-acyltransferase [Aspergillus alliaceus]|uniref:Acyl-CoA N-acyltransferase n=1 Tax=Petromyces alliaceus TaxID=209559 RepID=A0A5N7CQ42_PETAA|nr:acyl-CoA N-acyltransferase [Aspergillus alliaceus]
MPSLSTISLLPALPEDAPILSRVHSDAFPNNTLFDLMFGLPTEENMKRFTSYLSELIASDKTGLFVKAVDNSTNQIVGWSWWNFYLDPESHLAGAKAFAKEHSSPPESAINPETFMEYFQAVISRREKWVGGKPAAYLQVLVVIPEYQGKGIGTKLMERGLEKAATHNLPIWLESSEDGYALYKKLGFKDLNDTIIIDFAKYGESGKCITACMLLTHDSS